MDVLLFYSSLKPMFNLFVASLKPLSKSFLGYGLSFKEFLALVIRCCCSFSLLDIYSFIYCYGLLLHSNLIIENCELTAQSLFSIAYGCFDIILSL
uniref:Putative ovule protein n=1 Tax=Solanum chacoense TaxID=4108 RepID=A0A0V0ING7_SOLCH